MTELSSQLYDNVIRDRYPRPRHAPRESRTALVAHPGPGSGHACAKSPPREKGILCHVDLANAGTAVAVLTEDIGRLTADGLHLIGRVSGAEARGCSLAVGEFVEARPVCRPPA